MPSHTGSQRSFNVHCDNDGSSINIHIFEQAGVSAENLSLSTWGSSFVLANLLHKIRTPFINLNEEAQKRTALERPSVLELGAGTGLVGISAVALRHAKVLLTDLAPILPGLDANISLNKQLLSRTGSSASCGLLDWTHPSEIHILPGATGNGNEILTPESLKLDLILAADTLYSAEHPELVTNAILTWLAPGANSRAILCYLLRVAYLDDIRRFWELMESAGLECLEEGREEGSENWNEVANTPYEWCIWGWQRD